MRKKTYKLIFDQRVLEKLRLFFFRENYIFLYEKGGIYMSPIVVKYAKFITTIISAGLTLAVKGNTEKIMMNMVAKKVAEELAKRHL